MSQKTANHWNFHDSALIDPKAAKHNKKGFHTWGCIPSQLRHGLETRKLQSVYTYNELRFNAETALSCTNCLKFCWLIFQQYIWVIGRLFHYTKNSFSSPCTSRHKHEQKDKAKTLVKFPNHIFFDFDVYYDVHGNWNEFFKSLEPNTLHCTHWDTRADREQFLRLVWLLCESWNGHFGGRRHVKPRKNIEIL